LAIAYQPLSGRKLSADHQWLMGNGQWAMLSGTHLKPLALLSQRTAVYPDLSDQGDSASPSHVVRYFKCFNAAGKDAANYRTAAQAQARLPQAPLDFAIWPNA
jgi:isocitrate lyase